MLTVKTPEEVLAVIQEEFSPLAERTEEVPLDKALSRILAGEIRAAEYVPSFHRSTVDGFALRAGDTFGCSDSIPAILTNRREVLMGEAADFTLNAGECAPIPTGGQLPDGADAVQMIEYSEDYGDGTTGILKPAAPGHNVILKGDDVYPGKRVLSPGRRLTPPDIGALSAMGVLKVPVIRPLKVGILSTGDELIPPEDVPGPGQIRDVNTSLLSAFCASFGALPQPFGIVPDVEERLGEAVDRAVQSCDLVLLSGGSSVGIKDAACRILEARGRILFHGIAVKPGKPTIFAKIGEKPVIGLPGHPVAAFFISEIFLKPLMARLCGLHYRPLSVTARLSEPLEANHGRAQYNGVFLSREGGELIARPIRGKSGLITSLAASDGYLCVPRDCEGLPAGAPVQVIPYSLAETPSMQSKCD